MVEDPGEANAGLVLRLLMVMDTRRPQLGRHVGILFTVKVHKFLLNSLIDSLLTISYPGFKI